MTATKPNAWIDRLISVECKHCYGKPQPVYHGCAMTKPFRLLRPNEECFKTRWERAKKGEKVYDRTDD